MNIPKLQPIWTILCIFYLARYVNCACEISNVDCVTRASHAIYKTFISGIKGLVESSDPVIENEITADLATVKCHLKDVKLTGLSDCTVTRVALNVNELKYEYFMRCPQLVITGNGEFTGHQESVHVEGKGNIKLIIEDYVIELRGDYRKYEDVKDKKMHVAPTSFKAETKPLGSVTFEVENKPMKYDQQKSIIVEKIFRNPVMDTFLAKFLVNYDKVLSKYPILDILAMGDV